MNPIDHNTGLLSVKTVIKMSEHRHFFKKNKGQEKEDLQLERSKYVNVVQPDEESQVGSLLFVAPS